MRKLVGLLVVFLLSPPTLGQEWVARYNGPADTTDEAYAIAVDVSGNVYVTGTSYDSATDYDYATIKYSAVGMEEKEITKSDPELDSGQNPELEIQPNPFIQSTTIKYHLPTRTKVSLKVYDIMGRLVKTLVNAEKEAGCYNVRFDAKGLVSGIYFAKLRVGDYKMVKKVILVR